MKTLILLFLTILVSSCIQAPVNKKKDSNKNQCLDKNATNYKKVLPCVCSDNFKTSFDKKSCVAIDEEATKTPPTAEIPEISPEPTPEPIQPIYRACRDQPLNTVGGQEQSLDNGINWTGCLNPQCNSQSILINNQCIIKYQKRSCSIANGSGNQTTDNGGQYWSSCKISQCNHNFLEMNGICKIKNDTKFCSISNGIGFQDTIDAGLNWGECKLISCDAGFELTSNTCKFISKTRSCSIANGIGTQSQLTYNGAWTSCVNVSCNDGYTSLSNKCLLSKISRSCVNQPKNSIGGFELSEDAGQHWGECKNYSCSSNFSMTNGTCIEDIAESPILDFSYYVNRFVEISIAQNKEVTVSIDISFSNDLNASGVLGTCTYATTRFIKINQQWWSSATTSNSARQYVMYHELGHCILNRSHKSETTFYSDFKNIIAPMSIMYPAMISDNVYKNNMNYYHRELFDETVSTENIPLYYADKKSSALALVKTLAEPLTISISSSKMIDGKILCNDAEIKI